MKVTMARLEPWQRDVFEACKLHNWQGTYVIKSIRQVGKSYFSRYLLLFFAMYKKKSVSLFVSPIMEQSRKVFDEVAQAIGRHANSNGTFKEITLQNGSKILFRSAEQGDNLRGLTISGALIIDEAAFIPDDKFFYSVLLPMTNVYKPPIFMFSTPQFKMGFFYNNFNNKDGVNFVFDWTQYDTSKYLTPQQLAIYKKQVPTFDFNREYLGLFAENESSVFSHITQADCTYNFTQPVYIGVDWGGAIGKDYTAIACAQIEENKETKRKVVKVIEVDFFNTIPPGETIQRIIQHLKGFPEQYIIVEKNSIGNVYSHLLIDALPETASLRLFETTNKSKDRAIKKMVLLNEQKKLILPDTSEVSIEFASFESSVSSFGLLVYGAARGFHDDIVMATAFLVDMVYDEVKEETNS